jgi:steroid delta-isomerase-like uncharacterized protein
MVGPPRASPLDLTAASSPVRADAALQWTAVETSPESPRPVDVVGQFVLAWESNDVGAILSLFADDAVWYDGYPANPYVGREQIRSQLERYSRHLSDISIEVLSQAADQEVVFQERVDRGFRDGKPFAVAAVCVFTVRDGKIQENRDYWNPGAYRGSS